ncbi:pollen-specific leucine-rich repeat extensin-like protein 1 [Nilaparvata lugens]|uniref:pollen-specific leucine-rich repeat extensin-like protein 1 n=1 Tax=Nilaparvata lugens TaxID=108931 RepID=UPI00193D3034|nr:pollen-specific leucine-rich repeat extensin-like protein 1 [Nilaparvata lugens]
MVARLMVSNLTLRELGLKESMWLQKQSDDNTIYEQMKSLREENERYKTNQLQQHASQGQLISQHHHHQNHHNQQASPNGVLCVTKKKKKKVKGNPPGSLQPAPGSQLESLQKEIRESETDYKSQIAKAEQKSYENWLTSRQFERKLKESQGEATQLRNMLTMIEKNSTNHSTDDLKQSISEVSNGDPSSPPPRFLPPPPTSPPFMMFQPPPPLYPSPDTAPSARPPTLGRISSPPLDHHHPRFSPPPPHPPYLFDPPPFPHPQHSPSPPPPLPHRPLPKPPHMSPNDRKESMSPGYSEHHDRPNRRSKR